VLNGKEELIQLMNRINKIIKKINGYNMDENKNQSKKNILLITVDCLRADHLGCMGNNKNLSPNIDELASNGIIFANAVSNGYNTLYSVPSFLTSTLPPFKETLGPSIAELLKKNGYVTATFNPNPVILMNLPNDVKLGKLRLDKGFDTFDIMLTGKSRASLIKDSFIRVPIKIFRVLFSKNEKGFNSIYFAYDKALKKWPNIFSSKIKTHLPIAKDINREAIKWLEKNKDNKFFLWLHYMDVHEPYAPPYYENKKEMLYLITKYRDFPNKLTDEEVNKLHRFYEEEIKYTDESIGKLTQELKKMSIYDNTIIIISADHGDAFREHGALGHGTNFVDQLYDEVLRVPLIIHGAGKGIDKRQVELLDLAPTICELLSIPIPFDFNGDSLFSSIEKGVISRSRDSISYRTLKYKLIVNTPEGAENELYDLESDPEEKINIYNDSKQLSSILESEMIITLRKSKMKQEKARIKKKIGELSKKGKNF